MSFILSIWANNGNCPIKLCNRTSIAHWRKYSWQLIFMIFHLGLKAVVGLYRRISTGNFSTKDTSIHLLHPHLFHVPPNSTVPHTPSNKVKLQNLQLLIRQWFTFQLNSLMGFLSIHWCFMAISRLFSAHSTNSQKSIWKAGLLTFFPLCP